VVKIDAGKGAIEPTEQTIYEGTYTPLSRPIYIYTSDKALEKSDVKQFVKFYLENASVLAKEVGFVPLPESEYQKSLDMVK
jgi:phosphate transport system substrate-binding protein